MTKPKVLETYSSMVFFTGAHYDDDPSHSRLLVVGHSFYLNRATLISGGDWYHALRAKQNLTPTDRKYIDLKRNICCGKKTGKWPNHPIYERINDMLNKALGRNCGFALDHVAYCNYFYRPGTYKRSLHSITDRDRTVAIKCMCYTISSLSKPDLVLFATEAKPVRDHASPLLCRLGIKHEFVCSPVRPGRKRFCEESLTFMEGLWMRRRE